MIAVVLIIVMLTTATFGGIVLDMWLEERKHAISYQARHAQDRLDRREQRRLAGDPDWQWDTWYMAAIRA